jgi:ribosome-binding protein aMBF1 (putative translation factor)
VRGRPNVRSARLSEDLSRRIDAWIAAQPEPRPSRSDAIRRILSQALGKTADVKSPELPRASDGFLRAGQCRMARAALGWNMQELATKAGVGINTVNRFESGAGQPRGVTLDALRGALEAAGVEFIAENGGGTGVMLRKAAK